MKRKIIVIENDLVSVPATNENWMTTHEIANLFDCFISKISANILSILKSDVLDETKVCQTCHYQNGNFIEQYSLEMIIALSFRIKSRNAESFREWLAKKATTKASEVQMFVCGNSNSISLN